jgi:hypothetical protein
LEYVEFEIFVEEKYQNEFDKHCSRNRRNRELVIALNYKIYIAKSSQDNWEAFIFKEIVTFKLNKSNEDILNNKIQILVAMFCAKFC